MDLSGAYDQELLFWEPEQQLGVAAHTLQTLWHQLHSQSGWLLEPPLWRGVWPGARLPSQHHTVHLGPAPAPEQGRPGCRCRQLGYADDAGLCGQTPEELQQLIDCYCDYCGENGLLVNPAKCEAMVFAK
jgi:hypothetical protein